MATETRLPLRDSPLSRTTRALFAFLFRNALPVDPAEMLAVTDDITRWRRRELARSGDGLVLATTYRPSDRLALPGARAAQRGHAAKAGKDRTTRSSA